MIKILIVEDDLEEQNLLLTLLEKLEFSIKSVTTGLETISIAKTWQPDLVLLNSVLPDIDSLEVLDFIKQNELLKYTIVIMVSSDFSEQTVLLALASRVDEFINKPYRKSELILRIDNLLRLKQKEKLLDEKNVKLEKEKSILTKYFSTDFVDEVFNENISSKIGGKKVRSTVMFFDIRDSTALAEELEPIVLANLLSKLFSNIMRIIYKNKGFVNRMLGDGMLILFGSPKSFGNDALNAVTSALQIRSYLKDFNKRLPSYLKKPIFAGIGIATGSLFVGNIGSSQHMEYTVIGDTVNIAARLESLTKQIDKDIVIDLYTKEKVDRAVVIQKLSIKELRGKSKKVELFKVMDLTPQNLESGILF